MNAAKVQAAKSDAELKEATGKTTAEGYEALIAGYKTAIDGYNDEIGNLNKKREKLQEEIDKLKDEGKDVEAIKLETELGKIDIPKVELKRDDLVKLMNDLISSRISASSLANKESALSIGASSITDPMAQANNMNVEYEIVDGKLTGKVTKANGTILNISQVPQAESPGKKRH